MEICIENYGKTKEVPPTMSRQTKISFLEVMVSEQDSKNKESLNQRGRAFQ